MSRFKIFYLIIITVCLTALCAIPVPCITLSGNIHGVVWTPRGIPYYSDADTWAEVRLIPYDLAIPLQRIRVGPDGVFDAKNLPAGDYHLHVEAHGVNNPYTNGSAVTVHVEAWKTTEVDLRLYWAAIEGYVLTPDGGKISHGDVVTVKLISSGKTLLTIAETVCQPDGSFRLGGEFPSGSYLIAAEVLGSAVTYADSVSVPVEVSQRTELHGPTTSVSILLSHPVLRGRVYHPDRTPFLPDRKRGAEISLYHKETKRVTAKTNVNSDGTYRFGINLPAAEYLLILKLTGEDPAFLDPPSQPIRIEPEKLLEKDFILSLPMLGGRLLKPDGKILDIKDGVELCLQPMKPEISPITRVHPDGGKYRVGDIAAGAYLLWVEIDSQRYPFFPPLKREIILDPETPVTCDLTLAAPLLQGRILTPEHTPLTTEDYLPIRISLQTADGSDVLTESTPNQDGFFWLGGETLAGEYLCATTLDETSVYFPPMPVKVRLAPDVTRTLDIVLSHPLITGKVYTPADALFIPADECQGMVSLWTPAVSGGNGLVMQTGIFKNGYYKLGGEVPPGDYFLSAMFQGPLPMADSAPVPVRVTPGQITRQDLQLQKSAITGTVLGPDGQPLDLPPEAEITVILQNVYGTGAGVDVAWTRADAEGFYRLGAVPRSGNYQIWALVESSAIPYCDSVPVTVKLVRGASLKQDLNLTFPLFTGQVYTPDGKIFLPEADYTCRLKLLTASTYRVVLEKPVDKLGRFQFGQDLPPGSYQLETMAFGAKNPFTDAPPLTVHLREGKVAKADVRFTWPMITGRVLTPNEEKFLPDQETQIEIILHNHAGEPVARSLTDQRGTFKFGGRLPAGEYQLYAVPIGNSNPYANSLPVKTKLEPDKTGYCEIPLTRPVISGQLLTPEGSPYMPLSYGEVDFFVFITPLKDPRICMAWASGNRQGVYRLGGNIPPGDYLLQVIARGSNNPYTGSLPVPVRIGPEETLTRDLLLNYPVVKGRILTDTGKVFIPEDPSWACVALLPDTAVSPTAWEELHRILSHTGAFPDSNWFAKIASTTMVNNDGTFRIGGPIPPGNYRLHAYAGGDRPYSTVRGRAAMPAYLRVVADETATIDLRLVPQNTAPQLEPIGPRQVNLGETLTITLRAGDTDNDPLTFSAGNLPPEAQFDPKNGVFTWTPKKEGTYTLYFSVTDDYWADSEEVTITVVKP